MRRTILIKKSAYYLKAFLFCTSILLNLSLFSQKRTDTSYTYIAYYDVQGQDAPEGQPNSKPTWFGSSFDFATFELDSRNLGRTRSLRTLKGLRAGCHNL